MDVRVVHTGQLMPICGINGRVKGWLGWGEKEGATELKAGLLLAGPHSATLFKPKAAADGGMTQVLFSRSPSMGTLF